MSVISNFDHLVLTVSSIDKAVAFYEKFLGMRHEAFKGGSDKEGIQRHSVVFDGGKINLHEVGKEFEPRAKKALPGTADICLITNVSSLSALKDSLVAKGLKLEPLASNEAWVEGAKDLVWRTGSKGKMRSFYFRDEDQNLIEVSKYGADEGDAANKSVQEGAKDGMATGAVGGV